MVGKVIVLKIILNNIAKELETKSVSLVNDKIFSYFCHRLAKRSGYCLSMADNAFLFVYPEYDECLNWIK